MSRYTTTQDALRFTVCTAELELTFSRDDGRLQVFRRVGGPNLIGFGVPRPMIDLQVGLDGAWLGERMLVRYLSHTIEPRDNDVEINVTIGIGPLVACDRYRVSGTLIIRRVTIENVSEDAIQLHAVRMALPWIRLGDQELCRFEAPSNSVRPHVPLTVAAAQRRDVLPRRFFAPGLREGRALEISPTHGPGVLALHESQLGETLLCWCSSDLEASQPLVEGNDSAVTLIHEVELADRLRAGIALSGGTQYIVLTHEPWPAALAIVHRTHAIFNGQARTQPQPWLYDAAICEVHPSLYGGFRGLTAELDTFQAVGIDTLCLLPVWAFGNLTGTLWDGNWIDSGNLYAISDYEALDPTLGTAEELRQLVDAAHARGMRVLLDLPLGGCAPTSRYVIAHPDWLCQNDNGEAVWLSNEQIIPFDWANRDLQEYVLRCAVMNLQRFDLDGFRCVPSRRPVPNWSPGLLHHASAGSLAAVRWIERLRVELRAVRRTAALISIFGGPIYAEAADAVCDEMPHHMLFHAALYRVTPAELCDWLADHAASAPTLHAARLCFVENSRTRLLNPLADGMRGSRISRSLLCALVLSGFVPLIRAEQLAGEHDAIARLFAVRAQHATLRHGASDYHAIPCDSPHIFAVLRSGPDGTLAGLVNLGPHKHTATISLPVDRLGLPDGDYVIQNLLGDAATQSGETWSRDDLAAVRLTIEPFAAYCLRVAPAPQPAAPAPEPPPQALVEVSD